MGKQDPVKLAERILAFEEALWQVTEIHALARACLSAHVEVKQSQDRIDALSRRLDWLEAAHLNLAKEHDAALKERNDARAEITQLRSALEGVAPACRAFLDAIPIKIRADATSARGVYMWRRSSNVPNLVVEIGVPECEAVIAALDGPFARR